MNITINVEKQVEVKTLQVEAGVRYWEDAEINGVSDENGDLTPCRKNDLWCPIIDLETGKIANWEQGKEADIHFKVCDNGTYSLHDKDNVEVAIIENDYVPSILCPTENGYGDYIIMKVDKSGKIQDWKVDLSDFEDHD